MQVFWAYEGVCQFLSATCKGVGMIWARGLAEYYGLEERVCHYYVLEERVCQYYGLETRVYQYYGLQERVCQYYGL